MSRSLPIGFVRRVPLRGYRHWVRCVQMYTVAGQTPVLMGLAICLCMVESGGRSDSLVIPIVYFFRTN